MIYSIGETVKYSIILSAVVIVAVILVSFLAGYKAFSQMFGIYSKSYVMRGNKSRGKEKVISDARSKPAQDAAEEAKKLFFTNRISGSPFYLPDGMWAKKPCEYSLAFGKDTIYAYFFSADDFAVNGKYCPNAGRGKEISETHGNRFAVCLHGYDGCGLDNYKTAYEFMRRGISVISPDLTGHGKDGGKFVSYGYRDRLYALKWIEFILSHKEDAEIYLYGVSMGGATALYALGEALPSGVKGCISDCSFAKIYDECVKQFKKRRKIPMFPVMNIAVLYGKIFLKYDIKKASVKAAVEKNEHVPILFFHGKDDGFVTPDRARTLYDCAKSKKELVLYDETRHAESMVLNFDDYWKKIESFINSQEHSEEVQNV